MKILIVDDDPHIARLLVHVLNRDGHDIHHASTGSAALAAAISTEFDVLISDLMLPDLQGIEIIRAIKAQSPTIPVLVISGLDPQKWKKPCEDAGAARYLAKPFNISELRKEIYYVDKARIRLGITVVDEEVIHSNRLARELHARGCQAVPVPDVATAQELIGRSGKIGLILLDKDIPGAFELIGWAKDKDIPVFVLYTKLDASEEDKLMRAGAALFMSKPVNIDALLIQAGFMLAGS
jgi:DNA-binding response OmpR family regulator